MIAPIKLRIFFTINYLIVNSYKKQCSISNRLPFFSINYLPVTVKHKSLQTGTNNADKWLILNKLPLVLFCHILILSEHWPLNTSFTVLVLQHNIDHTNFNFNFNFNFGHTIEIDTITIRSIVPIQWHSWWTKYHQ
jgi:hypothetical protein